MHNSLISEAPKLNSLQISAFWSLATDKLSCWTTLVWVRHVCQIYDESAAWGGCQSQTHACETDKCVLSTKTCVLVINLKKRRYAPTCGHHKETLSSLKNTDSKCYWQIFPTHVYYPYHLIFITHSLIAGICWCGDIRWNGEWRIHTQGTLQRMYEMHQVSTNSNVNPPHRYWIDRNCSTCRKKRATRSKEGRRSG